MRRLEIPVLLLATAFALAAPAGGAQPAAADSPYATWGYPFTGFAIGKAGLEVIAQPSGPPRIFATAESEWPRRGDSRYWFAGRAGEAGFVPEFVSSFYRAGLRRLAVGDLDGDGTRQIVLGLGDGSVVVHDETTFRRERVFATSASDLEGLVLADCSPVPGDEIVLSTSGDLSVLGADGAVLWNLAGVAGGELLVGQVDGDAGIEIVTSGGDVIDVASRSVQWTRPGGPAAATAVGDVDLDGRDEIVVALPYAPQPVVAYDVETGAAKWSLSGLFLGGIEALLVETVGSPTLFVADQLYVHAYDPLTLGKLWSVANTYHGVTALRFADVDGDSAPDLLWGGGDDSTAADRLFLLDPDTPRIKWQSEHLDMPAMGPAVGDLDGDGRGDLVLASRESDGGYSAGHVVAFLATGGEAILAQAGGSALGTWDVAAGDVDGDGRDEALVASERGYDALVDVVELASSGELRVRETLWLPDGTVVEAIALKDLDGDGQPELVVGKGQGSTAGVVEGITVVAYEIPSMAELWRSSRLGSYFYNSVLSLRVVNTDNDPAPEVHVLLADASAVRILDGATGQLEATLPGYFTAMDATVDRLPGATGGTLMVGDSSGTVTAFGYRAGVYREVFRHNLGSRVDGISILGDRIWIGADGRLVEMRVRGRSLREMWRSADYGPRLGRRTVPSPFPGAEVITVGLYGAFGFAP
jgi:hypothetical protein